MSQKIENPTEFDHHSETNIKLLRQHYTCGCEPYEDVFTFNRWLSQGFAVKKRPENIEKGKWGFMLRSMIEKEVKRTDGTTYKQGFPVTTYVFCRCQVKRMK